MRNKKTNINLIRTFLCLWSLLFAGNGIATSGVAEKNLPLLIGDYLTVEYIDLIKQTRSPMIAGERTDHRQYISLVFDEKDKVFDLSMMGSFHEGLEGLVLDTNLNIVREHYGEKPAQFNVVSRSEFAISADGKTLIYRNIGNLKQFLARSTVSGKYRDSKGSLYTFTDDGLAIFPDRKFQYEVPADLIIGFDQIYEENPYHDGLRYGFKFINNELLLFNMIGPMGDKPEAKPFVTLTRIGDADSKCESSVSSSGVESK